MTVQIISGRAARRNLQTPPGQRTRPTQSRVREALFSIITSRIGPLSGLRVLDGFSGSGALGLEAWSRGASEVWLAEAHPPTAKLIQANAHTIGAASECHVICGRLPNALSSIPPSTTFDLVLLDPPYGDPSLTPTLLSLLTNARLHTQSLLVVEHSAAQPPHLPPGLTLDLQRSYGDSAVSLLSPDSFNSTPDPE